MDTKIQLIIGERVNLKYPLTITNATLSYHRYHSTSGYIKNYVLKINMYDKSDNLLYSKDVIKTSYANWTWQSAWEDDPTTSALSSTIENVYKIELIQTYDSFGGFSYSNLFLDLTHEPAKSEKIYNSIIQAIGNKQAELEKNIVTCEIE